MSFFISKLVLRREGKGLVQIPQTPVFLQNFHRLSWIDTVFIYCLPWEPFPESLYVLVFLNLLLLETRSAELFMLLGKKLIHMPFSIIFVYVCVSQMISFTSLMMQWFIHVYLPSTYHNDSEILQVSDSQTFSTLDSFECWNFWWCIWKC